MTFSVLSTTSTATFSSSSSLSSSSTVGVVSMLTSMDAIENVTPSSLTAVVQGSFTGDDVEAIKTWECFADGVRIFSPREEVNVKKQQSTLLEFATAAGVISVISGDSSKVEEGCDIYDGDSMNVVVANGTRQVQQSEYAVMATNNIFDKRRSFEKCMYVII